MTPMLRLSHRWQMQRRLGSLALQTDLLSHSVSNQHNIHAGIRSMHARAEQALTDA